MVNEQHGIPRKHHKAGFRTHTSNLALSDLVISKNRKNETVRKVLKEHYEQLLSNDIQLHRPEWKKKKSEEM